VSETATLQLWHVTSGIDLTVIQQIQSFVNTVNCDSLRILNSHNIGTGSLYSTTFKPDIVEIAFAFGSVYQATVNGINNLFNITKKENLEHTNSLFFDEVKCGKNRIQLKHNIAIDVVYTDDYLEGQNEELNIFLAAHDIEQLRSDFQEEFFVMWDVYSKEPDEKLTKKAKEIKDTILNLVKGVSIED
jgi:hypothetical protein